MKSYWSCSKFSDWLRSLFGMPNKLKSGTSKEWKEWKDQSKKNKIGYFIVEILLDKIQDFIYFPYYLINSFRIYFRNRFISKLHYLPTKLKPGEYNDLDQRLLYGIFNSLVDFVEIEKASMQIGWNNKDVKYSIPLFRKFKLLFWNEYRNSQAGVDYLLWEISLTDENNKSTQQAISAEEILKLYNWWKYDRPKRINPYDLITDNSEDLLFDLENNFVKNKDIYKQIDELEEKFYSEDQENLIRLIKIRRSLWT